MKRRALSLLIGLALAGCSSTGESQRFVHETAPALVPVLPRDPDPRHAALVRSGAAAMDATDAATGRSVRLRRAATLPEGAVLWLAPDGRGFTFRGGLLVGTRGLSTDLVSADVSDLAARLAAGRSGTAERFHARLDGEGQIVLDSYVCTVTVARTRAREDCTGLTDRFINTYRISPGTGAVLSSRQHPHGRSDGWHFVPRDAESAGAARDRPFRGPSEETP